MTSTIQVQSYSTRSYFLWLKERGFNHYPVAMPVATPVAVPVAVPVAMPVAMPVVTPGPTPEQVLRERLAKCSLCPRSGMSQDPMRTLPDLASLQMVGQLTALVFVDAVEPLTTSSTTSSSREDETGELLAKMLRAIQLGPEDYRVYPTVFCGSTLTVASPKDLKTCLTHGEQLAGHLRPRVILALGGLAAQTWAGHPFPWSGLRGKLFYPPGLTKMGLKIPVLATFHPRDLIRFPGHKKNVWEDLKRLRSYLDGQAKTR